MSEGSLSLAHNSYLTCSLNTSLTCTPCSSHSSSHSSIHNWTWRGNNTASNPCHNNFWRNQNCYRKPCSLWEGWRFSSFYLPQRSSLDFCVLASQQHPAPLVGHMIGLSFAEKEFLDMTSWCMHKRKCWTKDNLQPSQTEQGFLLDNFQIFITCHLSC